MRPPLVDKFIGGDTIPEVLSLSEDLSEDGINPLLNRLGEHYTDTKPVSKTVDEYEALLQSFKTDDYNPAISLKPTQLGLDISKSLFKSNAEHLVTIAQENSVFVWFDMEHHETIDSTIDVYQDLLERHGDGIGLCLQANIIATRDKLDEISEFDGTASVRIVKGAYEPPGTIAYKTDYMVDREYKELVDNSLEKINGKVAVGTHDEDLIQYTLEQVQKVNSDAELEFQMLKGVREDRLKELADQHDAAQYVPYGSAWLSYTYRRVRENPKNLLFVGRSIFETIKP